MSDYVVIDETTGEAICFPAESETEAAAPLMFAVYNLCGFWPESERDFLAGSIFNDWTADFIGPYDERRTLHFDDTENTFTFERQPEPLEPNEELYMPDPRY